MLKTSNYFVSVHKASQQDNWNRQTDNQTWAWGWWAVRHKTYFAKVNPIPDPVCHFENSMRISLILEASDTMIRRVWIKNLIWDGFFEHPMP